MLFNSINNVTGGGIDYSSGNYTVTFPAGHTNVVFNVSINNDAILEGSEIFNLTISPSFVPSGVIIDNPDQIIVTIMDDEGSNNEMMDYIYILYYIFIVAMAPRVVKNNAPQIFCKLKYEKLTHKI